VVTKRSLRLHHEQPAARARYGDVRNAIRREKEIKGWLRQKKVALIERANPKWKDLSMGWFNRQSDDKLRKVFASLRGSG